MEYSKKSEGKRLGMSGIMCSLSGTASARLAEAVARVDQPWETMIGW